MSGSRWFVSKSKESRRERARASHNHHGSEERRDDYVPSHHRRGATERASERSRQNHGAAGASSSPDRKDNARPSAAKNTEGGHGHLVFRRQERVKVKQRTPDGSPRRDDHKTSSSAPSKSRGRGDSKKPSGDDELWASLGHVYNEASAWALRESRERLTSAWVAKHQNYLRRVFEESLKRTRLPHDARNELTACITTYGTLLGERAKEFVDWALNVYDASIPDESRICLVKALLEVRSRLFQ
ncbi:hypothetical protein HPB50_004552 [Hyalomma asiaticum]|uniref:Uncharacterized protein n=1 Tax=Hyalomma asiaticum TaxID=266040 RepID=A0ACB7T5R2_HYAAI|nr:hypothetical protein HPB50_004552 [Hyalomma asiaticum]